MSAQTKWRSVSFVVVNMACLNRFPDLLAAWLPDGRRCGQEWVQNRSNVYLSGACREESTTEHDTISNNLDDKSELGATPLPKS
jgi:hypothetical protein